MDRYWITSFKFWSYCFVALVSAIFTANLKEITPQFVSTVPAPMIKPILDLKARPSSIDYSKALFLVNFENKQI